MYQALVDIAKMVIDYGGLTGVILIFWMADRYFLVKDLKSVNDKVLELVKENTAAYTKMTSTVEELCRSINNLCSRI